MYTIVFRGEGQSCNSRNMVCGGKQRTNDYRPRTMPIRIKNIMVKAESRNKNSDGKLDLCGRLEDIERHNSKLVNGHAIAQALQPHKT